MEDTWAAAVLTLKVNSRFLHLFWGDVPEPGPVPGAVKVVGLLGSFRRDNSASVFLNIKANLSKRSFLVPPFYDGLAFIL